MSVLDYLVEIHRGANWSALFVLYGAILALGSFGCLLGHGSSNYTSR